MAAHASETTVLSLETGHQRDYSEGAAYRDYFRTDRLMFEVQATDDRLNNKDEVVVMLLPDAAGAPRPLAIDVDLLRDNRVFQTEHAGRRLVVVTTRRGANRVFDAGDGSFTDVRDDAGWSTPPAAPGASPRTRWFRMAGRCKPGRGWPPSGAFWFGWYAQFPDTTLIK